MCSPEWMYMVNRSWLFQRPYTQKERWQNLPFWSIYRCRYCMQKVPIIALPSTSLYYVLKTVPLQRLLYQDYLDLNSTVHHKSHLLIYLCAIALPLCSTTYNRCTELWDADSSPSEGPIHPNLAFLCIPVSVGLDCLHFLVFSVGCIPGAILDMALKGCLGIADGSQPHGSILYGRKCAGALNIGGLSWASVREV